MMPTFANSRPSFVAPAGQVSFSTNSPEKNALMARAFCSYVRANQTRIAPAGQSIIRPTTEGLLPVLIVAGVFGLFVWLNKSSYEQEIRERNARLARK
jgi:hypothetical protein